MKRNETQSRLSAATTWILIAALVFLFAVAFDVGGASAAWDGTAADGFAEGFGSESYPWLIRNEAEMAYLLQQLEAGVTYSGSYFRLEADLDMTGGTWTPAGVFSGDFDGNCRSITLACPLFKEIGAGGRVHALSCFGAGTLNRAILCGDNSGTIEYCVVNGDVLVTSSTNGALFCTYNRAEGVIRSCGAVGSVRTSYSLVDPEPGDEFSTFTAMVANNGGVYENCWCALTAVGNSRGKYGSAITDPLLPAYHGTTGAGCWYDADVYGAASSQRGSPLSTQDMQSEDFLMRLNAGMPLGLQWSRDTANVNGGYPVLKPCLEASASIVGVDGDELIYHTGSYSFRLGRTGASGTIYYTLDGSDPIDSPTRTAYQAGTELSVSGDLVVRMAVESDGVWGAVRTQRLVQMVGAGTEEDPYCLNTKLAFDRMRADPDAYYLLCADLAYTEEDYTAAGVAPGGWMPIPALNGALDGGGHTITGLRGSKGGMIHSLGSGAVVKNLQLVDHMLYSSAPGTFGAIADSSGGEIRYCYVRSAFTTSTAPSPMLYSYGINVGGVVGTGGTVRGCVSEGLIPVFGGDEGARLSAGGIAARQTEVYSSVFNGELYHCNSALTDCFETGGICGSYLVTGSTMVADCRADGLIRNMSLHAYNNELGTICRAGSVERCVYTIGYLEEMYGINSNSYNMSRRGYAFTDTPQGYLESSYPDLDFETTWVMTANGPMPVGANYGGFTLSADTEHAYVPASCEQEGSTIVRSADGAVLDTPTFPALGHSWDAGVETTPATSSTEGVKTFTCARCGATKTEPIPVLPPEILGSGSCGENVAWTLDEFGVLTISGEGDVTAAPWLEDSALSAAIRSVVLTDGVTGVKTAAFTDCEALTSLSVPATVTSIQYDAFSGCTSLTDVTFGGTLGQWYSAGGSSVPNAVVRCTDGVVRPNNLPPETHVGTTVVMDGGDTDGHDYQNSAYVFGSGGGLAYETHGDDHGDVVVVHYVNGNGTSRGGVASAEQTDASSGMVHSGDKALRLNYDFRNINGIEGACFGFDHDIVIEGDPLEIGLWVYAPENTPNLWLRVRLRDGTGAIRTRNFTTQSQNAGMDGDDTLLKEWNLGTKGGINWVGWKYIACDLSGVPGPITLLAGETIRIMDTNGGQGDMGRWVCQKDETGMIVYGPTFLGDPDNPNDPAPGHQQGVLYFDDFCVVCAHEHVTELRDAREATCTEPGYTGDLWCTVCGELIERGEEIPAPGHQTERRGAAEPTETEPGYTGDLVCTVCGELIEPGEEIPPTGGGGPVIVARGNCGEHVAWTLNDEGLLRIFGTGPMDCGMAPWQSPFTEDLEVRSIVIEEGVESIDHFAFLSVYPVSSVQIPASVTSIGYASFINIAFEHVYYDGTIRQFAEIGGMTLAGNAVGGLGPDTQIHTTDGTYSGAGRFYGDGNHPIWIKETPEDLTISGAGGTGDYTETSGSLADITYSPFRGDTALRRAVLEEGVTEVGSWLFCDCAALETVTIPVSVTRIGQGAFSGCAALSDVYYAGTRAQWDAIEINFDDSDPLRNAEIHCMAEPEPFRPIVSHPADAVGSVGETVTFTVVTQGEGLTYQWQYCQPGKSTWYNSGMTGSNTPTLQVVVSAKRDGQSYRCVVSNAAGESVTSDPATLTVLAPQMPFLILAQPKDASGAIGEMVQFTVQAQGEGLQYQWQYAQPGKDAWYDSSAAGAKTDTLTIQVTAKRDGQRYRCVVTDAAGNKVITDSATLTVAVPQTIEITVQPKNQTVALGANAVFTVEAQGEGLTYQWQYCQPGRDAWYNSTAAGAKTDALTIQATAKRDGQRYRCVITDAAGNQVISEPAALTIGTPQTIEITAQPADQTVPVGTNATFTVQVTGEGLTYQWQYCQAGKDAWYNSSAAGAKTDTLTIAATAKRDGQRYRCVITDAQGNQLISDPATLHIG